MIIPRNPSQTGYVIEFKAVDEDHNETMEAALDNALKQIEEKKYPLFPGKCAQVGVDPTSQPIRCAFRGLALTYIQSLSIF